MTKWTEAQLEAIQKEGMPILVSAGAGSGKTAVLTERVFRKVKEGVPLNSLLILTFTKAAAGEMKQRIRMRLQKEGFIEEAKQVDASYITTFDSYALSLVKKYHYICEVDQNIAIVDSSIIALEKEKILDQIFENRYETDSAFCNFISKFCTKDDTELKSDLLNMHHKLDLKYDKCKYLKTYIEEEMSEDKIDSKIDAYLKLLQSYIQDLNQEMEELQLLHEEYYHQVYDVLCSLLNSHTYEEIKKNCQVMIPRVPDSEEEVKTVKEDIASILKEIIKLTRFESISQIKQDLLSTKEDIQVIISILLELEQTLENWKKWHNAYEFHDIANMAIRVIEENDWIQEELKNSWNEILLDEYQDTNDLQERLIGLIANKNVYMVGDIKQSIYRFRNANPKIFKEKYDWYREGKEGIKIDLTTNFRSRKEPLEDINLIFNHLLKEETGGADYKKEHQMIFGNQDYEQDPPKENRHLRILEYEEQENYTKEEMEAFIVAQDIQDKINNHFQVMDQKTKNLRDVTYCDFVILVDRATQFDLYRKIFDANNIPFTVYKDETITSGIEIRLFYHILKCMEKMENHVFDEEWKYAYISISRSYLLEEKDSDIFETIRNQDYEHTKLWGHIVHLLEQKNIGNNETLLQAIIKEFDFYAAFIKVGKVEESMIRIEYLLSLAKNLSILGYDWHKMMEFLKEIADRKYEIRFSQNVEHENSVHMMTIHKSKGLEYPICYYTGLYVKFNQSEIKERMIYDETYGFIVPVVRNGIQSTMYKDLMKYKYRKEEMAEKIRLFYVALTRVREQIILVLPKVTTKPHVKHYQSFMDMIKSVYEKLENYVEDVVPTLSKDYLYHKPLQLMDRKEDTLVVTPTLVDVETFKDTSFSKKIVKEIDQNQYQNIEFGKYVHHILECFDFEHPNYEDIPIFLQNKIKKFLKTPIFQDHILHIYQEYEFYEMEDKELLHGIIDLMVEYEDAIYIVDYKLKQIDDDAYRKQLKGYQTYIEKITSKKVCTYLYSILDETLEQIP